MTPLAIKNIDPNLERFLFLITETEGTDRQGTPYNELYGYDNFTDFSKHPNINVTKGGLTSTAAGRYQMLKGTWDGVQAQLNLPDFSPLSQDKAAIQLIKNRGAYDAVINGDFQTAIAKTNKEWASLPGSPYGQPTYSLKRALDYINSIIINTGQYVKNNPVKTGIVIAAGAAIIVYYIWAVRRITK